MSSFQLQPFPDETVPEIAIAGTCSRQHNRLTVVYEVTGDGEEILVPAPATPTRKHDLWQETCFEFFLGLPDAPQYWEFNLSPAGDWNVYAFDDYRQRMREEDAIAVLPFTVSHPLKLELSFDLGVIVPADQTLEIAITAVIQTQTQEISYWALMHPGLEADFHRRDSFVLEL
jgi:hypothetical protein